ELRLHHEVGESLRDGEATRGEQRYRPRPGAVDVLGQAAGGWRNVGPNREVIERPARLAAEQELGAEPEVADAADRRSAVGDPDVDRDLHVALGPPPEP